MSPLLFQTNDAVASTDRIHSGFFQSWGNVGKNNRDVASVAVYGELNEVPWYYKDNL